MTGPAQHTWTVGELAALTGLSVRTFHHYDKIGLLQPSIRTQGGHRRYLTDDVTRLAVIIILRRAGMPLADIKSNLASKAADLDVAGLIEQQANLLESSLIETLAFGRKLAEEPISGLANQPARLRQLVSWMPQHSITVQPIIFLVYADVERAYHRLIDMFGFQPGPVSRGPDGTSGYAEVSGPMGNIRLHAPRVGLSPPDPTADPSAMTVVGVADIHAHLERARRHGAKIVRPLTTLFGMDEYQAFDHEYHLWCFQQPTSTNHSRTEPIDNALTGQSPPPGSDVSSPVV